ncbi:Ras- protein Rab-10, partial [Lunasporangiospora selenospora]
MNPSVDDIEQIRIVLAGDSGVGKTSLIGQFLGIGFQADLFCPTVGANVEKRRMNIRGQDISVQIIDTCGQERFRAIPPMHFREAAGVILVYDIRRPESFKNIYRWLWMVKDHAPEDASILLVGNKADLESERAVSTEEGETLANERQLRFLETSATDKDNVDWAFA